MNDNHHVAGKDMCVGFFRLSVFEAEYKASICSTSMCVEVYARVSVECGMCKASGNIEVPLPRSVECACYKISLLFGH